MARRTPRQSALGVQRATTQRQSAYVAPTANNFAGSEFADLAKGFAGLTRGLGALEKRSRLDDEEAARLAKEEAKQREVSRKEAEAEAKRLEAEEEEIRKEGIRLGGVVAEMRESGATDVEVKQFFDRNTTGPLQNKYAAYREKTKDGNVTGFLGAMRDPRLSSALNAAQGHYHARGVFADNVNDLRAAARDLMTEGALKGFDDAQVLDAIKQTPAFQTYYSELNSLENPLQTMYATQETEVLMEKFMEDMVTEGVKDMTNQVGNAAIGAVSSGAASYNGRNMLDSQQSVRQGFEDLLTNFTGSDLDERMDDAINMVGAELDAAVARGTITEPQAAMYVENLEGSLRIKSTKKSLLVNAPAARLRLTKLKSSYSHSEEATDQKQSDRVAAMRDSPKLRLATSKAATRTEELALIDSADAAIGARLRGEDLDEDQKAALEAIGADTMTTEQLLDMESALEAERVQTLSRSSQEVSYAKQLGTTLTDSLVADAVLEGTLPAARERYTELAARSKSDPIRQQAYLAAAEDLEKIQGEDAKAFNSMLAMSPLRDSQKKKIAREFAPALMSGEPLDRAAVAQRIAGFTATDAESIEVPQEVPTEPRESIILMVDPITKKYSIISDTSDEAEAGTRPAEEDAKVPVEDLKSVSVPDFDAPTMSALYQSGRRPAALYDWILLMSDLSGTDLTEDLWSDILAAQAAQPRTNR